MQHVDYEDSFGCIVYVQDDRMSTLREEELEDAVWYVPKKTLSREEEMVALEEYYQTYGIPTRRHMRVLARNIGAALHRVECWFDCREDGRVYLPKYGITAECKEFLVYYYKEINIKPSAEEIRKISIDWQITSMQAYHWFKDVRRRGLPKRLRPTLSYEP
jgi:hypothetical protein